MSGNEKETWTYEDISDVHVSLLRSIAVLPFKDSTLSSVKTRSLTAYHLVATIIYNTMFAWPVVKMLINRSGFEITTFCECIITQNMSIRYWIILTKREEFAQLMAKCKELWGHTSPEESRIIKPFAHKAYLLRAMIMSHAILVVSTYVVTAYFVKLPPIDPNGTARRRLPFSFYVDVQEEPMFSIVALFQSFICYSSIAIVAGIETCGVYSIMMACGFFRCIHDRLIVMAQDLSSSFNQDYNYDEKGAIVRRNELSKKDVLDCVIFHQNVLM